MARRGTSHGAGLLALDRVPLEQVVANLVLNAIEAVDEVTARDRCVRVQTTLNQRDEVEVAVSDNGPGMPTELADRIFEPFFTTREQGMGMGLAISRSIVEEHGGRLWVTPNRDHGVTFRFTLPKSIETDP